MLGLKGLGFEKAFSGKVAASHNLKKYSFFSVVV